jgi:hypothetical protein
VRRGGRHVLKNNVKHTAVVSGRKVLPGHLDLTYVLSANVGTATEIFCESFHDYAGTFYSLLVYRGCRLFRFCLSLHSLTGPAAICRPTLFDDWQRWGSHKCKYYLRISRFHGAVEIQASFSCCRWCQWYSGRCFSKRSNSESGVKLHFHVSRGKATDVLPYRDSRIK